MNNYDMTPEELQAQKNITDRVGKLEKRAYLQKNKHDTADMVKKIRKIVEDEVNKIC